MPLVDVVEPLPLEGVPQKPEIGEARAHSETGMVIGFPFQGNGGIPVDIMDTVKPSTIPPGSGWVSDTPWGKGLHLSSGPYILGSQDEIVPPFTYHVLFKPDFPPNDPDGILVFGELKANYQGQEVPDESGIGLKWGELGDTMFAYTVYNGQRFYSYTPIPSLENQWIALTFTHDGSEGNVFINGVHTMEGFEPPRSGTDHAAKWVFGGPGFSGTLADARVYNRVLPDWEIDQIVSGPYMWDHYRDKPRASGGHKRRIYRISTNLVRTGRRVGKIISRR